MKNWIISSLLIWTLGTLQAQQSKAPGVHWLSFEQLSDSLQTNPKPVFLFFHTDWCSYCKKMLNETFHDPQVVKKLNQAYYAVEFDAERVDTVFFDGVAFTNSSTQKSTGQFHELARILIGREQDPVFPATLLLQPDFQVRKQIFNYLSIRQLLNIL